MREGTYSRSLFKTLAALNKRTALQTVERRVAWGEAINQPILRDIAVSSGWEGEFIISMDDLCSNWSADSGQIIDLLDGMARASHVGYFIKFGMVIGILNFGSAR